MDNVVQFPRKNVSVDKFIPTNEEEIIDKIETLKHHHIHETLATVIPILFANLEAAGFDLMDDEDQNFKDGAFIVESIRALLCKQHGVYHPFQEIAANVFLPDTDQEGMLKVVESLNLNLNATEKGNS